MKFEVLVHGVPYWQDYWGPNFDRSYAAQFYNTSENGLQYVVETRKADGKNYCYYTIVRYGNVLPFEKPNDNGSRRGSYVAVTYRFDMFYTDAKRVFQILETVFEKCILGSIIEYSGTNYKFLCRSLKEKEDVMKKVEDDTLKLLQLSVLNDKFLPIDDAFIHQDVKRTILSIDDCTDSNVLSALKQVSKVVATLDAPDARDKKIAELQGDLATEKAQHQKDNEVWRGKLEAIKTDDKLIAENQNLSNELFQSKKNYEGLESRFKKLSKKWNIALCILVPLLALSLGGLAYLKFIAPQQLGQVIEGFVSQLEYDKLQQKNTELELALKTNDTSGVLEQYQKDQSYLKQKIDSLKQENKSLKQENDDLKQETSKFQQGKEITDPSREEEYPDVGNLEINFKNASQPFYKTLEYTVEIKCTDRMYTKDGLYDGYGTWKVEGFMMEKTANSVVVKLKAVEDFKDEERKITFTLPNGAEVVRTYEKINGKGGLNFKK